MSSPPCDPIRHVSSWLQGCAPVHETFSAETETGLRPRRYKLPRRLVKSSKQSPQVAAYRDNWSGIRAKHVAFIIWAFYGLVNAVVVCDTGFCRVLVCCWCRTAAAGSDLDWLLFNSLSLACVCHQRHETARDRDETETTSLPGCDTLRPAILRLLTYFNCGQAPDRGQIVGPVRSILLWTVCRSPVLSQMGAVNRPRRHQQWS